MNPAIMALITYLQAQGVKNIASGLKSRIKYEQQTAQYQSQMRMKRADQLAEQWDMFRTGNIQQSRPNQLRAAGGIALQGAAEFQRAMANNYMLLLLPQMISGLTSTLARTLNATGINNQIINSLGIGAMNISRSLAPITSATRYAQYINPLYALTSMFQNQLSGVISQLTGGNFFLSNLISGPLFGMTMPLVGKLTSAIAKKLTPSLSRHELIKLRPITINAKYRGASEFVDQQIIDETNHLINHLYSLDPKGEHINVVEIAQLNMLSRIAAHTSSIPILTSEFVNNITGKNISAATAYNTNLNKLGLYNKGKQYADVIAKHAERMEHGQFMHTFTENVGLAATEFSSFLNKMAIGLDLIKQLQIVFSGGNIRQEMHKFDKAFQTIEQRKAALFAKRLGIGEEESYVNMYYSITEDSQSILSRAKTFEDAQIGLLAGIYEFTRLTAVESATIRTKAYGIKEPVKYNVIGKSYQEEKTIFDWLADKIPFFETFRMLFGGLRNIGAFTGQWLSQFKGPWKGIGKALTFLLGAPSEFAYHNELYNKLASGFDIRREASLLERVFEPVISKLNQAAIFIGQNATLGNIFKTAGHLPVMKQFLGTSSYLGEQISRMARNAGLPVESIANFFAPISNVAESILGLRLFAFLGNKNRMGLLQRKKIEYSERGQKEFEAILKEVGIEKLSTQEAFYKYATTSLPDQFDLMIHHLTNIALFTHAIMINTANMSQAMTGTAAIEKPATKKERFINRYTGQLVTAEEYQEFMKNAMHAAWTKTVENALESKSSLGRFLDYLKYGGENEDILKANKRKLSKGFIEIAKYFFEKERLTAESSWEFATRMLHKPLFTKEFLEELEKNPEAIEQILSNPINKEYLLKLKNKYGSAEFSEYNLAAKNENALKELSEYCSCVTISEESWETGISLLSKQLGLKEFIKVPKLIEHTLKTENAPADIIFKYKKNKVKVDNTFEGIVEAIKNDTIDNETKQTQYLNEIVKNTEEISKTLSTSTALIPYKKNLPVPVQNDEGGGLGAALLALAAGAYGLFKSAGVKKTLGFVAKKAGPLATGATLFYGAFKYNSGRASDLIEKLDERGIIEHNILGNSVIKDWSEITKLNTEQLSLLYKYNDWDDKTKHRLKALLDAKLKRDAASGEMFKYTLKNEDQLKQYLKIKQEQQKKGAGVLNYAVGKAVTYGARGLAWLGNLGYVFSSLTSKDRDFIYMLQDAGVLNYNHPFESEIYDWGTLEKLDVDHLKILSKLNLSKEDRKHLEYLIKSKKEYKYATEREQIRKYERKHKVNKNALARHARMSSYEVVSELEDKGVLVHHWLGKSEIKDWDAIKKLDREQIKKLIEFDDWDEETKEHLQNIYQAKIGKQLAEAKSAKTVINPFMSDIEKTIEDNKDTVLDVLKSIPEKLDALMGVISQGSGIQVQTLNQVIKTLKEKTAEKIQHPIFE